MDLQTVETLLEQTVIASGDNLKDLTKDLEQAVGIAILTQQDPTGSIRAAFQQFTNSIPVALAPLREYVLGIIDEFDEPSTPADTVLADRLFTGAADRVRGTANNTLATVLALVATGLAINETANLISSRSRAAISGVFLDIQDPLVRRAQRRLDALLRAETIDKDGVKTAVDFIRKTLSVVDLSDSLRDSLNKEVSDIVYDFHGAFVLSRAKRLGYTRFRYVGGLVRNSRDFCINHVNKTYTEAEIRRIWNTQIWSGKRPGDPFVVRGGYRCRHYWVPVKGNNNETGN